MDVREAIEVRRSCRAYTERKIEGDTLRGLEAEINSCAAESGLSIMLKQEEPGVFNGSGKSYGLFKGVRNFVILAGKDDAEPKEKAGYYGERIVLKATELGLGTCWVGATFDKERCAQWLPGDETIYCVITVGYASDKTSLMAKMAAVMNRKSKPIEALCTVGGEMPAWFRKAVEAVQKAPSAMNKQPVHFELTPENAVKVTTLPGGYAKIDTGIAKYHFETGAAGADWHYV